MKKNEDAITIISLVVTIVVLIIIAGVAINQLDEGGVLEEVDNHTKYQQQEISNEQDKMDRVKNEQLKDWGF